MLDTNKDIIIKLFKTQFILRNYDISNFNEYYNNKLLGLVDVCDRLQEKGIDTIKLLNNLFRKDLSKELITITGIYNILSKENLKIFISVVNIKKTENYINKLKKNETYT